MTTAIIVAAGKSERMGAGTDKAFLSLGNKPVVAWSLIAFERCPEVDRIILVVRKDQQLAAKAVVRMFGISKLQAIVPGGNKRQESVMAGLAACDIDTRYVMIHDGARPCIKPDVIAEVAKLVKRVPAVTVGRRMTDTVKRVENVVFDFRGNQYHYYFLFWLNGYLKELFSLAVSCSACVNNRATARSKFFGGIHNRIGESRVYYAKYNFMFEFHLCNLLFRYVRKELVNSHADST